MRKIYFILSDRWGWTVSDIDKVEFYMIEYLLQDLDEKIKEENKMYKKQEEEYKKQQSSYKPPKIPNVSDRNYGGFKIPDFTMPKLNIPKIR
ncbi:MAG TPA: hypothetical protein P5513_04875 [Candidatus Diapherotrites archaeon]|nr:hypothetical protein [Candidatus Diapherotrites archaeon]